MKIIWKSLKDLKGLKAIPLSIQWFWDCITQIKDLLISRKWFKMLCISAISALTNCWLCKWLKMYDCLWEERRVSSKLIKLQWVKNSLIMQMQNIYLIFIKLDRKWAICLHMRHNNILTFNKHLLPPFQII